MAHLHSVTSAGHRSRAFSSELPQALDGLKGLLESPADKSSHSFAAYLLTRNGLEVASPEGRKWRCTLTPRPAVRPDSDPELYQALAALRDLAEQPYGQQQQIWARYLLSRYGISFKEACELCNGTGRFDDIPCPRSCAHAPR